MLKRIGFFAYGSLSYLIFLGTFLYAIGFIGNFGVPTTLDGAAQRPLGVALIIDGVELCRSHSNDPRTSCFPVSL